MNVYASNSIDTPQLPHSQINLGRVNNSNHNGCSSIIRSN